MRALVTGAANGIGRELTKQLAVAGYGVVLFDVDEANMTAICQELSEQYSELSFEQYVVDITDELVVADACQKVLDLGPVDLLINNAGVGHYENVVDMNPTDFKQQIAVNLIGAFNVTHGILAGMVKANQGLIVNIGSRHSFEVAPSRSAYCASKFGLRGLSLCLELELKSTPIKVTIIEPHSVVTNFNNALVEKERRQANGEMYLQPEQVASVILDLITGRREWASEVRIELDLNNRELLVESLNL